MIRFSKLVVVTSNVYQDNHTILSFDTCPDVWGWAGVCGVQRILASHAVSSN